MRIPHIGAMLLAAVTLVACGRVYNVSHGTGGAPSPTHRAAAPTTDLATCQGALRGLRDYHVTAVALAAGGSAMSVQAWVAGSGLPDRGLTRVNPTSHVSVCVFRGTFSFPHPAGGLGDGGRFFILPAGPPVLDAEGSLSSLVSATPRSFS